MNKEIYEGWRIIDFIDELEPLVNMIMRGEAITPKFNNKAELSAWVTDNQPYYKKEIPEVISYFAEKYEIG